MGDARDMGTGSDASMGQAVPGAAPRPADDWPLQAVPYGKADIAKERRWLLRVSLILGAITIVLAAIGWYGLHAWNGAVSTFLLIVAAIIGTAAINRFVRMGQVSRMPDDGVRLDLSAILQVYKPQGLAEIRLATPTIRHYTDSDDDDDDHYVVNRNGVDALWWRPAAGARTYTLWWRDEDWFHMGVKRVDGERVSDDPMGHRFPDFDGSSATTRYMDKFMVEGIDLRMWPCVLEVRGDRARLMFDPNAAKTDYGPLDPRIHEGIGDMFMLADTFR